MADDRFIEEHRELVHRLASKVRAELDLNCELEDLAAYGFEGLVQARQRFDPSRGVRFSTFAYYRVRGAIVDGVRQMAYLPRRVHRRLQVAEATDRVAEPVAESRAQTAHPEPALEQAAANLDGTLAQVTAAFALAALGQQEPGEDEAKAEDGPEEALLSAESGHRLREAVEILPERERALVRGFYFEGRRFDRVAAELGISKSWASRLHSKALRMLRDHLDNPDATEGPGER